VDPSPASDVYALASIGWFALTGAPHVTTTDIEGLTVEPGTPPRLVQVLSSCLCTDPTARPTAGQVAAEVFDASRPEPVHLGSVSDPAAEITRRIRAAAVSAPAAASASDAKRYPSALIIGVVALVVALALGGGAAWFLRIGPVAAQPVSAQPAAVLAAAQPSATALMARAPGAPPAASPPTITDLVTAPDSPRKAAADLLQSLVDARALAYAAREPALLDLVYAAGATKAVADRSNIATALKNGATYLGLRFAVKDVSFLDGTSNTARIRATIVTPAYRTGQPDGRKVAHPQEIVGPSVFTVKLAGDGWRILSMTAA
jgi:eukaryotic-like serine/threonine-protein kinase